MLPLIFAGIIGFIIIMYVILDGFDLGIGILFPFTHSERERDLMMNSVAPVWDGNETWLVFGAAMLYGGFPIVYGVLLPILYIPIMHMLIALIFRGVSFEFRFKAEKTKAIWNWAFSLSSIAAAFLQGVILGAFVQGFAIDEAALVITSSDWLTPFSLMTGIAVICGYALLGSTWMIIKSEGRLQKKMVHLAKGFLVLVTAFLIFVSIWTPLHNAEIWDRWYSYPNILLLSPLPVLTGVMVILAWRSLVLRHEIKPFVYSIVIFLCSYIGIGLSVFPYLIPHQITIWEAAAPPSTLIFILIGVMIMLPVLLGYTLYAYRVFWGKSGQEGYH